MEKDVSGSRGGAENLDDDFESSITDNIFLPLNLPLQTSHRGGIEEYTVRENDTIEFIAKRFNLAPSTIFWANSLSSRSKIKPGQTLKILPVDGVAHTVKKGETLGSLSLLYKVYIENIAEVNGLTDSGFIVAGETLIIPGGSPLPPPAKRRETSERILVDVRSNFANPAPGARRSQGLHWRNAVDLANSCGSPVVAASGGEVMRADGTGWNGGFGKYIMLSHAGGFVTAYGHLSSILVNPGQQVKQGERIGSIGATGKATGCHVHFEVRGAVNPFVN